MSAYDWFAQFDLSDMGYTYTWWSPLFESLHYTGHALVFGCILLYDLRLLGVAKSVPFRVLGPLTVRWAAVGLALAVVTGTILFLGNLDTFWANPMLSLKLGVIVLAVVNVALFHHLFSRPLAVAGARVPPGARLSGLVSLLCWTTAVAAGRLMVYFS